MTRKVSLAILVVGFLVASSFVGTAAFTSATVTRSSSVGISADNSAVIGLTAGSVAGVTETTSGELDVALGNGHGLNIESSFVYGDSSTVQSSSTYAFTMTNNADSALDFTVNYLTGSSFADSSTSSNLNFEFYTGDGTPLTESGSTTDVVITEDGSGQTFTLSSGETVYVVIDVDTTGLTSSDDLSGDLEITA